MTPMTTVRRWCAWAPILALLAAAGAARAADVGELVEARGDVRATPSGGAEGPMAVGDRFGLGLGLATGIDSAARLTFDPGGSLQLYDDTRVTIDQALIDSAGRATSRLSLLIGRLRLALSRLFQGDFEVETPAATLGIKGTVLEVLVEADGRTTVWVLEGRVTVRGRAGVDPIGEPVEVPAGFVTVVARGEPAGQPAPAAPQEGTLAPETGGPGFEDPFSPVVEPIPDIQRDPVGNDPP